MRAFTRRSSSMRRNRMVRACSLLSASLSTPTASSRPMRRASPASVIRLRSMVWSIWAFFFALRGMVFLHWFRDDMAHGVGGFALEQGEAALQLVELHGQGVVL